MRVRPFFWFLLVLSCAGVLIFAATKPAHAPAAMQVHVDQPLPISVGLISLELHLTDPQGLPIEQAHVFSHANMTNMDMAVNPNSIREVGQGNYTVQLRLYMAGPWKITIVAHAEGFDSLQRTTFVEVQ